MLLPKIFLLIYAKRAPHWLLPELGLEQGLRKGLVRRLRVSRRLPQLLRVPQRA